MSTMYEPKVGEWYKNESGDSFEVIAVDADEELVEIQYFDGTVEEFDFTSWESMALITREPPEDWSGPYDGIGREEMGEESLHPQVWTGPLDALEELEEY